MVSVRNMFCGAVCLAVFCLGMTGAAFARPEMAAQNADARFESMDKDKDGKLSKEEFFGAMPQMKEGAFSSIDKDGDGFITLEEWRGFAAGHGKDGKAQQGGMQMPPKDASADGQAPAPAPGTRDMPQNADGTPAKIPPALVMPDDPAGK